jgi:hypothetical protein
MGQVYRAVARLKLSDSEYMERGESFDIDDEDFDSENAPANAKEKMDNLIATKSVVTEEEFAVLFPGFDDKAEEGANQPAGTPSNLGETPSDLESQAGKDAAQAELDAQAEKAKADAEAAQAEADAEAAAVAAKEKASGKEEKKK